MAEVRIKWRMYEANCRHNQNDSRDVGVMMDNPLLIPQMELDPEDLEIARIRAGVIV